jgi:hypothetical protein
MKAIAGHRFHSIEFKRKIAQGVVEYAVICCDALSPVLARTRSAATARERRLSGVQRKKYAQDDS